MQSFIACFALATLGVDLAIAPSWAICSDVGKEYTGTLSGAMNMMGALGSFASSLAFPALLKITGAVQTYFLVDSLEYSRHPLLVGRAAETSL